MKGYTWRAVVYIDKDANTSLYEQIYQQIKSWIADGSIAKDTQLSGIRTLSKTLGVARNTVDKA
ncbi:GntR family transcriptional regulator [uncultured Oscillibacter sp.]|uniref:GntR family transcriptional regulator n=1 Tax=uncultured Oscillibacter sp. TaxID=876091 RepID=UPI00345DF1B1